MVSTVPQIHYKAGYKYQLHDTYTILTTIRPEAPIKTRYLSLSMEGELRIRYGYCWDGPSGPTWDTLSSMRGSLVHDALYQLMRMEFLDHKWKKAIDLLFERILVEDGMWAWRARIWYRGVATLAEGATLPENKKEVLTAPEPDDTAKYLGTS